MERKINSESKISKKKSISKVFRNERKRNTKTILENETYKKFPPDKQ